MSKKRILTFLITILILGGLLRLFAIFWRGPFRFDEIFTVHFSAYPLKNFSWIVYETNPPLFYFLMHFWLKIFGEREIIARLSALIFGLISIIVFYHIGKKIFSKKVGLLTAILTAFSSYQIFASTEARMYSLLFLLSGVSIYFFWQWINQPNKIKYWIIWLILSLLLIYTHLTGWLILITQFVYFLFFYRKIQLTKKQVFKCLAAFIILVLVFLIWFIPSKLVNWNGSIANSWFFHIPNTSFYFLSHLRGFINFGSNLSINNLLINIIILAGLFFFIFTFEKLPEKNYHRLKLNFNRQKFLILIWLFIPLVIGFCLEINYPLYFIVASGPFYLILSLSAVEISSLLTKIKGVCSAPSELKYKSIIPYGIICFIVIMTLPSVNNVTTKKNQVKNLSQYIQKIEQPNDKIIVHVFNEELTLRKYYQGNLPIEGFYPLEDNDSWDLRIIKKNWQNITNQDNVEKLSQMTNIFQRIFLIKRLPFGIDPNDLVTNWFHQNSWQLVEKKDFRGGFDFSIVYLFQRH